MTPEQNIGELTSLAEFDQALANRRNRESDPVYEAKVGMYADILAEAMGSRRGMYRLQEAMSTAEFPTYFGDVLQRMMLARFSMWTKPFERYLKTGSFNDLTRDKRSTQFRGGSEVLSEVGEGGPYPVSGIEKVDYTWKGAKYGRDFALTWETILADDLNGMRDLPSVMASSATASEQYFATSLYVDENGPHADMYTGGNGNVGSDPLTVTSLEEGLTAMASMTDPVTGNPLNNRARFLVVTPEDEINARRIVQSDMVTYAGATSGTPFATSNIVSQLGIEVIVDPWIRVVGSSIDSADKPWFLFADPNSGPLGPGLAAAQFDRLRGAEQPMLLQKRGEFQAVGGGADPRGEYSAMDTLTYRVIHAFGGGQLFPQATYASSGEAGS